jgi:hypothetical protein
MEMIDPLELIAELEPYIRSGNDVPVTQATLPAALISRVIEALDVCETLGRHAADLRAHLAKLEAHSDGSWRSNWEKSMFWRKVACPSCGANEHEPCHTVHGTTRIGTHEPRKRLAKRMYGE